MIEHTISVKAFDVTTTVKIFGGDFVILKGEYDERQMFLPISCFITISEKNGIGKPAGNQRHAKPLDHKFAKLLDHHRNLFGNDLDLPQPPLPFSGWKRVSNSNWKKLVKCKYPGWDKGKDKMPNSMTFDVETKSHLVQYCNTTCVGRYCIPKSGRIYFELENDYVMAKIGYGTGD